MIIGNVFFILSVVQYSVKLIINKRDKEKKYCDKNKFKKSFLDHSCENKMTNRLTIITISTRKPIMLWLI